MRGSIRTELVAAPTTMSVQLQLQVDELDGLLADARHPVRVRGRVVLPPLTGPHGAAVEGGTRDLLARTGDRRRRTMAYALPFRDVDGARWEIRGRKDVWHRPGLDLWSARSRGS